MKHKYTRLSVTSAFINCTGFRFYGQTVYEVMLMHSEQVVETMNEISNEILLWNDKFLKCSKFLKFSTIVTFVVVLSTIFVARSSTVLQFIWL